MRKILLLAIPIAMLASCATAPTRYRTYSENAAYYMHPTGKGFTTPLVSDISVGNKRISYEQTFANQPISKEGKKIGVTQEDIEIMKTYTLAQAAFANDADLIVYPLVAVSTSEDGTKITVKVTGFPGTYTNFRKATPEDFELIFIGDCADKGDYYEKVVSEPESKSKLESQMKIKDVKVTIENVEK